MIIRTKPGAESKKGSAAEGLQELKSAFLKSREQTERLERVIRLCETARAASDRRALGYTALNDTLAAIDYRQAALWWRAADDAGAGPGRLRRCSSGRRFFSAGFRLGR